MVSSIVENTLLNIKNLLDSGEYDACDRMLQDLKAFVHDPKVLDLIVEHVQKVQQEWQQKINEAKQKLEGLNALDHWEEGASYMLELRHWKTLEMLSFWNHITKQYDI
ncbi:MAG: hypothetical protein DRN08_03065 [Thermoplasmata archaeon]|nr:MAG: hypothetical protein DRN08_03065 [Thermoplasmata archaeon]